MMMRIEHIAIWCRDIEKMKAFYLRYFNATANDQYTNPTKQFHSYFISFETGTRIELMQMPNVLNNLNEPGSEYHGLNHFAVSVGNKEKVDDLTNQLAKDGYEVVGQPRTTGDGYYESVILDPEKNRIEITI
jgi:lactoylglutathione lyase